MVKRVRKHKGQKGGKKTACQQKYVNIDMYGKAQKNLAY